MPSLVLLALAVQRLLVPSALAAWPDLPGSGWAPIQSEPLITCTHDAEGLPWCYAEVEADVAYDRVVTAIEDVERYPAIFGHLDHVKRLDADTAWIHVDYPPPLSDRDYVARFTKVTGDDPPGTVRSLHIRFRAAEDANAPSPNGDIRLPHAGGGYDAWDLGGGHVRFRYTWETEIGGDLPSWMSDRARILHGDEVVNGVIDAAKGTGAL